MVLVSSLSVNTSNHYSVQAANHTVVSVALGYEHSAAILDDGSLWMWGNNENGQLGIDGIKYADRPQKVMEAVKYVACGGNHTAVIKTDNTLWTWGGNTFGQLGNGDKQNDTFMCVPQKIMDNVADVSLGDSSSAAVTKDGKLYTWGYNQNGELGAGSRGEGSTTPVYIMSDVKKVAFGGFHAGAIKNDNTLWMWGDTSSGALGIGETNKLYMDQPIKMMDNIKMLSLSSRSSAAIDTNGNLWTWGSNWYGTLGTGSTKTREYTPQKVMENAKDVAMGYTRILMLKENNKLWICGDDTYNDLQHLSTKDSYQPGLFMADVTKVYSGEEHHALIKEDGSLWMWGRNEHGKLGIGTNNSMSADPTEVTFAQNGEYNSNEITTISNTSSTIPLSDKLIQHYGGPTTVEWGGDLFKNDSNIPQKQLSLLSAVLSAAAEGKDGKDDYISKAYRDLGFDSPNISLYSYPDSYYNRDEATRLSNGKKFADDSELAFSIAHKPITVNGKTTYLVIITARGSKTLNELLADGSTSSKERNEFGGNKIYDVVYDFGEDIWSGLIDHINRHQELQKRKLKFLVTGHSLGGAAANIVAARLNAYSSNFFAAKKDIYTYTFGAIDSLASHPIYEGHDNIFNIYNILDTFGPWGEGWNGITAKGNTMYNKYGKICPFYYNFGTGNTQNHNIENYVHAVRGDNGIDVNYNGNWRILHFHCPVDLQVYQEGTLIGEIKDNTVSKMDGGISLATVDDKKLVYLPNDNSYDIKITATGSGSMEYYVEYMSEGKIETKAFKNIVLEAGKTFQSIIKSGFKADEVKLYVLDSWGKQINEVATDGSETSMSVTPTSTAPANTYSGTTSNYTSSSSGGSSGGSSSSRAKSYTTGKGTYKASYSKTGNKTVKYDTYRGSFKSKKATVPSTVKIGKKKYKVTSIAENAFTGYDKLEMVSIGKNIKKIGGNAFGGCSKLKTLQIKSKKLRMKAVKKAFEDSAIKTVYVQKDKVKNYKHIFTKKNTGSKTGIKVKAKR